MSGVSPSAVADGDALVYEVLYVAGVKRLAVEGYKAPDSLVKNF